MARWIECRPIGDQLAAAVQADDFEISWLTRTPPLILKRFYSPPNFANKLSFKMPP
jgi:hypothetical protein